MFLKIFCKVFKFSDFSLDIYDAKQALENGDDFAAIESRKYKKLHGDVNP